MKPTWDIRKLNEYSVDKNTAIIITDSEKDNYYWADIPDGSLLVNDKTGNLSIKLTGESDWVPMGIRKDGTEKLVKDAIINVEYYTIVKFELEHNRFYYHDREEITRIGKLINGKAQFKVGSGLYLPGTNQLEVLINDSVHRNTIDGGLEEINMKYFQIDADDIRLGSTVTVRYINYERLSELYPFIYTQEQVPWFFEDKDLWINPSDNVDVNGLTITPLSYYVKYLDNNEAEVIVFTTKNSRLIASRKMNEYVNKITDKNINRFKVTRENNNFYINLFSTYPGYKTSFTKVLIKGLISDEDKLTLDVDLTYPNSGMAKTSVKTQLGNIVTIKRNNKKIYAAQNIGIGIQHTLAREEQDYDITVLVKNPTNGLTKEKVLTIKKKMIHLTANIDHVTTPSGTTISVETIPGSKVKVVPIDEHGVEGTAIISETTVDASGRFSGIIPLTDSEAHYKVIVTNEKADNTVEENIEVLLHNPHTPLSAYRVDAYDGIDDDLKGRSGISIQAESGSIIVIKDQQGNTVFTHIPSNLSTEDTQYNVPLFYAPETKTFTVEANKTNKVPESKTITIQGYEKIDAPILFDVNDVIFNNRIWDVSFTYVKGSIITAFDKNNNIIKTKDNKNNFTAASDENKKYFAGKYYSFNQKNEDYFVKFTCIHPLYKDQEIIKVVQGLHLEPFNVTLNDNFIVNPYADLFNSSAYRMLIFNVQKLNEDNLEYENINNKNDLFNSIQIDDDVYIGEIKNIDQATVDTLTGGINTYKEYYDIDDLSNIDSLIPNNKFYNIIGNSNSTISIYWLEQNNKNKIVAILKVDDFNTLFDDVDLHILINNKYSHSINCKSILFGYKNIDNRRLKTKSLDPIFNDIKINTDFIYTTNRIFDQEYKCLDGYKYIHPIISKRLMFDYDLNKINKDELFNIIDQIKNHYDDYISVTVFGYIPNYDNEVDKKINRLHYANNIIVETDEILLFPSVISQQIRPFLISDKVYDFKYYNSLFNPDKFFIIGSLKNRILVKDYTINIPEDLSLRKIDNTSMELKHESSGFSSINTEIVFLITDNKLPRLFNFEYNAISFSKVYIFAPFVVEIEERSLYGLANSKVYINYSKLKKTGELSFPIPITLGTSTVVYDLEKKYILSLDILFHENEIVQKKEKFYNPEINNDSVILNKAGMIPCSDLYSTRYTLNININKDIFIGPFFFQSTAIKEFDSNGAKSVTFIDEQDQIISKKNINDNYFGYQNIIVDHNKSNNLLKYPIFGSRNYQQIPYKESYRVRYNSDGILGASHFYNCLGLKNINLDNVTNLYLYPLFFYNLSSLEKITLPSSYVIELSKNKESFNNDNIGNQFGNTYNLKTIENLDNVYNFPNIYKTKESVIPYSLFYRSNYSGNFNINMYNVIQNNSFDYSKVNIIDEDINSNNIKTNKDHYGQNIDIISRSSLYFQYLHVKPIYSFIGLKDNNFLELLKHATNIYLSNPVNLNNINILNDDISLKDITIIDKVPENIIIKNNTINSLTLQGNNKIKKLDIESNSLKGFNLLANLDYENMSQSSDNLKIVAPNLKQYQGKILYSTFHNVESITNADISFNKINKNKPSIMNYKDNVTPLAYISEDINGNTNPLHISYFSKAESQQKSQEKEVVVKNCETIYIFDIDDKNDIKTEKLIYDFTTINNGLELYNNTINFNNNNISFYGESYSINDKIFNTIFNSKERFQKFRWPALKEIVFKVKKYSSKTFFGPMTMLGVNVHIEEIDN